MNKPNKTRQKIILLLILLLLLGGGVYYLRTEEGIELTGGAVLGRNEPLAKLSYETDKEEYKVGDEILLTVYVNSTTEAMNAVGLELEFDSEVVSVESLSMDNSICTLFPENVVDKENNLVVVSCGLPSPGYIGEKGELTVITLNALKDGELLVREKEGAQILANDGEGTAIGERSKGIKIRVIIK